MGAGDHLRGALIALALLAHGIYALPLPEAVTAIELKKDWRQRDLEQWHALLTGIGLPIDKERLESGVVSVTTRLHDLHMALKAPFRPVFRLTKTNQAWALFASATTRPERIVVEIRRQGQPDFEAIERRLDPCCSWREDQFRYRRIRGLWDGLKKRPRPGYQNLTPWIARQAFADFDDAEEVLIYLEQGHSVYPWQEPNLELERRHPVRYVRNSRAWKIPDGPGS